MNDDVVRMQGLACDTRIIALQLLTDLIIVMMQCLLNVSPLLLWCPACWRRTLRRRWQDKGGWETGYLTRGGDNKNGLLVVKRRI